MNGNNLSSSSQTNWERIDALTDDQIDTSDIPPLTEDFFAHATLRVPDKPVTVTMHVDPDVFARFRAQGEEYGL